LPENWDVLTLAGYPAGAQLQAVLPGRLGTAVLILQDYLLLVLGKCSKAFAGGSLDAHFFAFFFMRARS
jgi:hypothetical protein